MRPIVTSLVIACALLIAGASRHGQAQSGQPTTVRVGWIGDTHFTDMYVMSEEMKDPGIKLQMNKFQLSQDEVNALAANSLDMASMGYIFFLKLLDKGVDVTAVSGVSERGTRLLLRKGVAANDWSDFKKLKVGVARGSTQELQFQSCLAENKVDVKLVSSVAFTNAVDMTVGLEQGAVDAAVVWEPQASQAVLKGIATEFRPVYPCSWSSNGMLVVRTEFLKKNRVAVVSILKGLASAAERLSADHDFWIASARKFAPLSPEIQALAIKNSGQSVTLHTADLPKMAAIMHANSYIQRKLEGQEIEAHIDLSALAEATGKSQDELRTGRPRG
jgi:ABC-type nitrate/sulfonate/bicarbonate transport system substrate-binding protein